MKDCPASEFGCSCGRCVKPLPDLDALKHFNRATASFATALILVALIAAIFAVGLVNADANQAKTAKTYQEVLAKW